MKAYSEEIQDTEKTQNFEVIQNFREILNIEHVDIDRIIIAKKDRARTTTGKKLSELMESIKNHGLFHPILINSEYKLIAGYRRLRACKKLGWTTIPTIVRMDTTELDDASIELQENVRRKNLSPYEIDIGLAKWKRIYEKHSPETKYLAHVKSGKRDAKGKILSRDHVANSATWKRTTDPKNRKSKPGKRFTQIAAQYINVSERTIRDRVQVGEIILSKKIDNEMIDLFKKGQISHSYVLKKEKERCKIETQIINEKKNKHKKERFSKKSIKAKKKAKSPGISNKKWCKDCIKAKFSSCPECGKQILICDKGYIILKGIDSIGCKDYAK